MILIGVIFQIFTHLFVKPRDVYTQLDHFMMGVGIQIMGKRYSLTIRDIFERREAVVGIGGKQFMLYYS